jgi:hypothetical protein
LAFRWSVAGFLFSQTVLVPGGWGCSLLGVVFLKNGTGDFLLVLLRRQRRRVLPLTPDVDGAIGTICSSSSIVASGAG